MKTVYKYDMPRSPGEVLRIPMVINSKILTIQEQHGCLKCWAQAEFDESIKKTYEVRKLIIYYTGGPHREDYEQSYLCTVQLNELLHHIYEVIE